MSIIFRRETSNEHVQNPKNSILLRLRNVSSTTWPTIQSTFCPRLVPSPQPSSVLVRRGNRKSKCNVFLSGMQDEEHTKFNIQNLIFWTQKMCMSSFGNWETSHAQMPKAGLSEDAAAHCRESVKVPGGRLKKMVICWMFCAMWILWVRSWLLDVIGLIFSLLKCEHLHHPGLACQGLNVCYGLSLHKKAGLSLQSDWLHWCAPTSSKGSKQICNSCTVFLVCFCNLQRHPISLGLEIWPKSTGKPWSANTRELARWKHALPIRLLWIMLSCWTQWSSFFVFY